MHVYYRDSRHYNATMATGYYNHVFTCHLHQWEISQVFYPAKYYRSKIIHSKDKIYPVLYWYLRELYLANGIPTPLLVEGILFSCCKKFSDNWLSFCPQDVYTFSLRKKWMFVSGLSSEFSSLGMIALRMRAADTWIVSAHFRYA